MTKPATIKFLQFSVTNGTHKARVWYSLDNNTTGAKTVSISCKDYGHALSRVLAGHAMVRNDTDTQTDYFDHDRVTLAEGHPLYAAARKAAEACEAKRMDKIKAKREAVAEAQAMQIAASWLCKINRDALRTVRGL